MQRFLLLATAFGMLVCVGRAHAQAPQEQLTFSPWTKFCLKDKNAKEICFTGRDARDAVGKPILAAVLIEPEGGQKKILRVTFPLGMQNTHGTRMILDHGLPANMPFVGCIQNGCMSDYKVTAKIIARFRKAKAITLQAFSMNGALLSVVMPLDDFAKAYDGPPTDPKIFEEQREKLQES